LTPEDLISITLDSMLNETTYSPLTLAAYPPEGEIDWAKELITQRIEELDLIPTEEELYTLMKLRMKV